LFRFPDLLVLGSLPGARLGDAASVADPDPGAREYRHFVLRPACAHAAGAGGSGPGDVDSEEHMSPSWPHLILGGGLGLAVLMLVLWLIHLPLRNAALVDFGWAAGLAFLSIGYA